MSFAGSGDIEAVQEQGLAASSAVPETEKPNAILWLEHEEDYICTAQNYVPSTGINLVT